MANVPPDQQHPIPDDIRVFWISYYECWAGRSMDECVEASMREFDVTREDAYVDGEAHEVPRETWDDVKCPNDPDERIFYTADKPDRGEERGIDWERTSYETLRQSVAMHATFPALIGQRE